MSKKIVNDPNEVVPEMMEGYLLAYERFLEKPEDTNGFLLKGRREGKVSLIIGGGSGHDPMFAGFLGKGLADAVVCGNVFTSPDPGSICEIAGGVDGSKGILFLYGNYAGDNMNFDIAEEMLQEDGIQTAHIRVNDDCTSAPKDRMDDRRGIAGDLFAIKIAGAACDAGLALDEVVRVTQKAVDQMRSVGLATAPGQIPGAAEPTFTLGENEIEYGVGIHGEPGIRRTQMEPADVLVENMYKNLIADYPLAAGDEVCVLINGLGSTTLLEMSIANRKLRELLKRDGVSVYETDMGSYCTCMEMGGFSITILKLDDELKKYYNAPCSCPSYNKEAR